ncbi:hypothetical protein DYQ86_00345 [Acidobacteria bacterium AB60]|nr:hypothetical protein DYQ86_00345 [Acidobacteria bacterium AB60]
MPESAQKPEPSATRPPQHDTEYAMPKATLPPAGSSPDQAVEHCVQAYDRAFKENQVKGRHYSACKSAAGEAFRLAMPSMGTLEGVIASIACVAHGLRIKVWISNEANELLYAAQVAMSAFKCARDKKGPPSPM